jgi:MYXO-CTERM domain-containing protein
MSDFVTILQSLNLGMLYGSLNRLSGFSRASFLATVNLDTGPVSVVGTTGGDGLGLGLAGLNWIARRRRSQG